MDFDLRYVIKDDYSNTLTKWWESWGWNPPPYDMLPSNGFIISKNGVDICAGFIYSTDSKASWLEYIVSNKEYKDSDRASAIEMLINCLSAKAKEMGFKYIYTSLKNKPLIKKYENCGFMKGDSNCQEMIKIL